jgi:hypothetical protein
MAVRIFAWHVEFMPMVGVLDRPDAQPSTYQFLNKINDERRLAVILATDDVETLHLVSDTGLGS